MTRRPYAKVDRIWKRTFRDVPRAASDTRERVDPASKKNPELTSELLRLIEPDTGGDPEGHKLYVRSSLRSLAAQLGSVSPTSVAKLLRPLGFSLRTNIKRLIGKPHPQRDKQYRFIQRVKAQFIRHDQPVISVDAKKTELIGNFKNSGARYCRQADEVNTYDFPSEAEGKAIPYGIFDEVNNTATVVVGTSAGTPQFAASAIRHWWTNSGTLAFPEATQLMIQADAGGNNGYRPRMWKYELQQLCNDTGLTITVCHYPSGASKWNPIEHRLFSQISRNWSGQPLRTLDIILGFIRGTTTTTGLKVEAVLDQRVYEKGITISQKEMNRLNIKRRRLCPDLNYTIRPCE